MSKLTERQYWERGYESSSELPPPASSVFKKKLKKLLGKKVNDLITPYDQYVLWELILSSHLPHFSNKCRSIEIGSAPGEWIVSFVEKFGSIPHGLEYTKAGVAVNRRVFSTAGFDEANVFEGDFFSDEVVQNHLAKYDIVISRGFIEHFDEPREVIQRHLSLLREGGYLIITIPNLRGIYGWWTRHFNPAQMPLHNLEIMQLPVFQSLFLIPTLKKHCCQYFGTFTFWMFTSPPEARWTTRFIRILTLFQFVLSAFFRLLLRKRGADSSFFSPHLVYIGQKI